MCSSSEPTHQFYDKRLDAGHVSSFQQWEIPESTPVATTSHLHSVHDTVHECSRQEF